MKGKIIKGVGGFYYIHLHDNRIFECKAKGLFRNQGIRPTVGDDVEIDVIDDAALLGNIVEILPRRNRLVRPAVANVDQAMIIFAAADPEPNYNLLDRFLIMMDRQAVKTVLCLNKSDLAEPDDINQIKAIYQGCGYDVIITSTCCAYGDCGMQGIIGLQEVIAHKTTVFAGPSGVGKSSLLNMLLPEAQMKTGAVSEKIRRGRHTTRHSELMCVHEDTFVMDTPGFSSLFVDDMEPEELKRYYNEFEEFGRTCRFNGCVHINEPECGVKAALERGKISALRYDNYRQLYNELKSRRRW